MNATWFWLALHDAFWSAVVAVGYAVLFHVPRRLLIGCATAGAVGHLIRTVLLQWGLNLEASTLVGATAVGFLGWTFARRWRAPSLAFTVPGVIPLAPGAFAYRTTLGIIQLAGATSEVAGSEALWVTSYNASKTMLILAAIAVGIAAPALLFRRHKPVV